MVDVSYHSLEAVNWNSWVNLAVKELIAINNCHKLRQPKESKLLVAEMATGILPKFDVHVGRYIALLNRLDEF